MKRGKKSRTNISHSHLNWPNRPMVDSSHYTAATLCIRMKRVRRTAWTIAETKKTSNYFPTFGHRFTFRQCACRMAFIPECQSMLEWQKFDFRLPNQTHDMTNRSLVDCILKWFVKRNEEKKSNRKFRTGSNSQILFAFYLLWSNGFWWKRLSQLKIETIW